MLDNISNTTVVTIASKDGCSKPVQYVCKFNQNGFCKFGQSCKMMHIDTLCNTTKCNKHMCNLRHPRACKYFSQNGHCKRALACAYSHQKSGMYVKVDDIKSEVDMLKAEIDQMKTNILKTENILLRTAIADLQKTVWTNTKHIEALQLLI